MDDGWGLLMANGGDDIRHLELGTFNLFDEEFRIKTLSNAILVPYL